MKVWQKILSEHHNVVVTSKDTVTVLNVIYDTVNKISYNDHIVKCFDVYFDSEGNRYDSIYDYLGY